MKKNLWMTIILLSVALSVSATDFDGSEPIKLTVPEMEPKLVYPTTTPEAQPVLSLRTVPTSDTSYGTGMNTNEKVKPYKFMDDMTFVGVPLFVAGIIAKSEKHAFRQDYKNPHEKTRLITNFKSSIDDYTQYFGPAMTLGLKIGGVEGRSDWQRFLVSAAMSYGIMAALVNGIKYTASEMRPDGSTANSWPSGHTATSFVGATILHKEYGLTRSPWYSVAGYGIATATGVMRVLNNRHWISDVLSGAGIGIISGELAYALSDLIYKEKHLLRNDRDFVGLNTSHPSFFDVSMGIGMGSKDIQFDETDLKMSFRAATVVQAEGAYFFNKYVGLGGRLRVRSSPINGWSNLIKLADDESNEFMKQLKEFDATFADDASIATVSDIITEKKFTIESDHLTEFSGSAGLYFNIPLGDRFALGTKILIGRSIMQSLEIDANLKGNVKDMDYEMTIKKGEITDETITSIKSTGKTYECSWDYLSLTGSSSTSVGTGLSLTYAYKNNFCWKVFCDFDHTRKDYTLTYDPNRFIFEAMPDMAVMAILEGEDLSPIELHKKKNMNQWVLGASFSIHF